MAAEAADCITAGVCMSSDLGVLGGTYAVSAVERKLTIPTPALEDVPRGNNSHKAPV
jgi:hypothetical protein